MRISLEKLIQILQTAHQNTHNRSMSPDDISEIEECFRVFKNLQERVSDTNINLIMTVWYATEGGTLDNILQINILDILVSELDGND